MKTFLKIILVAALAMSVAWAWPAALTPLLAVFALTLLAVALLAALGISVLAVMALLVAAVLAAVAALSPLWAPVALIGGGVWLACKLCGRKA